MRWARGPASFPFWLSLIGAVLSAAMLAQVTLRQPRQATAVIHPAGPAGGAAGRRRAHRPDGGGGAVRAARLPADHAAVHRGHCCSFSARAPPIAIALTALGGKLRRLPRLLSLAQGAAADRRVRNVRRTRVDTLAAPDGGPGGGDEPAEPRFRAHRLHARHADRRAAGLGPAAGTAILIPLTFKLDPTGAIIMLCAIYYGAMYGGTITSVLINVPGEAASVITCIDGYQMAQAGPRRHRARHRGDRLVRRRHRCHHRAGRRRPAARAGSR